MQGKDGVRVLLTSATAARKHEANWYLFIWLWGVLVESLWIFTGACGFSCPKVCGILVPWLGIKPECPALEGRFSTTGPLGKSWSLLILKERVFFFFFFFFPKKTTYWLGENICKWYRRQVHFWASLVAQMVKNLSAMQEIRVQALA